MVGRKRPSFLWTRAVKEFSLGTPGAGRKGILARDQLMMMWASILSHKDCLRLAWAKWMEPRKGAVISKGSGRQAGCKIGGLATVSLILFHFRSTSWRAGVGVNPKVRACMGIPVCVYKEAKIVLSHCPWALIKSSGMLNFRYFSQTKVLQFQTLGKRLCLKQWRMLLC